MSDKRQHRGPHPFDAELFSPEAAAVLVSAVADLSWLLSRGYSDCAALKLVGDRYQLKERQRTALMRSTCSDEALAQRATHRLPLTALSGEHIEIDGFNLLTTIEAALSGGVLLLGRDGCLRDMASMHGSYRKVTETRPAVELAGRSLAALEVAAVTWCLDRPVSNSGRLARILRDHAAKNGWNWSVNVVDCPDNVLVQSDAVVVSADCGIIERCQRWANLAREIVERHVPDAWIIRLDAAVPV